VVCACTNGVQRKRSARNFSRTLVRESVMRMGFGVLARGAVTSKRNSEKKNAAAT
jgi:hypothetical protein